MGRPYLIVTTGRTGSSLLAHALQQTGQHGTPDEHLAVPDIDDWSARFGVRSPLHGGSILTYLDALRARTSTPNGGFGTKVHSAAIPMLARLLRNERGAPSDDPAALLGWAFPDTVVLWSRRRDRVAGAISMWRARRTGTWARPAAEAGGDEADVEPSTEEISELHRLFHLADLSLPGVLGRARLPVHEVLYEDLVDEWDGELEAARRFLGEEGAISTAGPPTFGRQAGPSTEALVRLWVSATGGCAACGHAADASG